MNDRYFTGILQSQNTIHQSHVRLTTVTGPKLMIDTQHYTLRIHTPHSGFPHSDTLSVEC